MSDEQYRNVFLKTIVVASIVCLPIYAATPRRACEFVSSIGVNTHFGYTDEPYYSQADSLSKLLGALGVTFIRDGIDDSNWKRTSKIQDSIFRKYGIKMLACVGPRLPGTWPTPLDTTTASTKRLIDTMRVRYGDAILAIEGPNEYDLSHGTAETDWVKALSSYVQMLARVIRADAAYSHLPIVAPSLCFGHESQVGDISSFIDFGNTHSYPGGNSPATGLATNIVNAQKTCMTKPIWATETGYHTAINQPASQGHPGMSEEAQARYIPRLFAEYFRAGIYKTSTYEFLDERDNPANDDMEQHFGLVRFDCSVKPAYTALKNLIAVLRDDTAAFAPASFSYTLAGDTANVRTVPLQKQNGHVFLLVWQECTSYDLATKQLLNPSARHVTLSFAVQPQLIQLYRVSASPAPYSQQSNISALSLDVPDEILVVEYVPKATGLISSRSISSRLGLKVASKSIVGLAGPFPHGTIITMQGKRMQMTGARTAQCVIHKN
jgi:hypothetical protein